MSRDSMFDFPPKSVDAKGNEYLISNLDSLSLRFPEARQIVENSDISGFFYQKLTSDTYRIGQEESGEIQWLAQDNLELETLEDVRKEFRERIVTPKARIFILAGFGTGHFVKAIYEDLIDKNEALLVIEPNAALFQSAMHLSDLSDVLSSGKFFYAVGDSLLDQAEEILKRFHLYVIQDYWLLFRENQTSDPKRKLFIDSIHELSQVRKKIELIENKKVVEFRSRPREISADRIRKVWIYERSPDMAQYSKVQHHLSRKLAQVISQSGCEVSGPEFQSQTFIPPYFAAHSVIENDPDLILIFNTFSTDSYILGKTFSDNLKIPKISWFMDAPVIGYDHLKKTGLGKSDILTSTDAKWFDDVKDSCPEMIGRKIHTLHLAATFEEIGPEDEAWSCNVSYVGQVRDMSSLFKNPKIKNSVRKILDKIVKAMMKGKGQRLDELVKTSPMLKNLGKQYDLAMFLKTYYMEMIWESNSRCRVETLKPLAGLGLRIYGNPDWASLTRSTSLEKCFTGKTVDHNDLPRLFRNSRINVNIHHLQSSTSLNLRVFDIPAAGGFLITDYMPGLEKCFEIDKEVVTYRTREELREKVEYFLNHPEERREIAERARFRVLRDHTFRNRWQELLDILKEEGWNGETYDQTDRTDQTDQSD